MKKFINKIKNSLKADYDDHDISANEEEYVELNTTVKEDGTKEVIVRPFVMEDFSDIKTILDSLRKGNTIALINIKPLKDRDLIELKRAISKLKKTCSAIDGDIAGFGDDYIVVVPSFASIHRAKGTVKDVKEDFEEEYE
ncbi:MAG: cell division protein SepF [Candidatus Woesearchaeota archaeon]